MDDLKNEYLILVMYSVSEISRCFSFSFSQGLANVCTYLLSICFPFSESVHEIPIKCYQQYSLEKMKKSGKIAQQIERILLKC